MTTFGAPLPSFPFCFRFSRAAREQARNAAELAAAREIQQQLIPASLPSLSGFHIEAAYVPAEEVAGDFYQVIEQADDAALVVVGDVSGKGLKAATAWAQSKRCIGASACFWFITNKARKASL